MMIRNHVFSFDVCSLAAPAPKGRSWWTVAAGMFFASLCWFQSASLCGHVGAGSASPLTSYSISAVDVRFTLAGGAPSSEAGVGSLVFEERLHAALSSPDGNVPQDLLTSLVNEAELCLGTLRRAKTQVPLGFDENLAAPTPNDHARRATRSTLSASLGHYIEKLPELAAPHQCLQEVLRSNSYLGARRERYGPAI